MKSTMLRAFGLVLLLIYDVRGQLKTRPAELVSRIPEANRGGFSATVTDRSDAKSGAFVRTTTKEEIVVKSTTAIAETRAFVKRTGDRSAYVPIVRAVKGAEVVISADITRDAADKQGARDVITAAKATREVARQKAVSSGRIPLRTVKVKADPFKTKFGRINELSFKPDVESERGAKMTFEVKVRQNLTVPNKIDANVQSKGQIDFKAASVTEFEGLVRLGRESYSEVRAGAVVKFKEETSIAGHVKLDGADSKFEFEKPVHLDRGALFEGAGEVVIKPTAALYLDELGRTAKDAVVFKTKLKLEAPLRAAGSIIQFSKDVSGTRISVDDSKVRLAGDESTGYKTEYDIVEFCASDSIIETDGRVLSKFTGDMNLDCDRTDDLDDARRRLIRGGVKKNMRITHTEGGREARQELDKDKAPIIIEGSLRTRADKELILEVELSEETIDDIKNKSLEYAIVEFKNQGAVPLPVLKQYAQVKKIKNGRRRLGEPPAAFVRPKADDYDCVETEVKGGKLILKAPVSAISDVEDCITEDGLALRKGEVYARCADAENPKCCGLGDKCTRGEPVELKVKAISEVTLEKRRTAMPKSDHFGWNEVLIEGVDQDFHITIMEREDRAPSEKRQRRCKSLFGRGTGECGDENAKDADSCAAKQDETGSECVYTATNFVSAESVEDKPSGAVSDVKMRVENFQGQEINWCHFVYTVDDGRTIEGTERKCSICVPGDSTCEARRRLLEELIESKASLSTRRLLATRSGNMPALDELIWQTPDGQDYDFPLLD